MDLHAADHSAETRSRSLSDEEAGRQGQGRPARDTHALPPDHICEAYWKYNKIKPAELDADPEVVDFRRGLSVEQATKIRPVKVVDRETIRKAGVAFKYHGQSRGSEVDGPVNGFEGGNGSQEGDLEGEVEECTVYEFDDFPGLQVYSGLLPPEIQLLLLSRIMHRDLANPHHKTNINADYDVPHPTTHGPVSSKATTDPNTPDPSTSDFQSFFTLPPQQGTTNMLQPLSPPLKPLHMAQFLLKKLRWLTLGQQYHWPTRSYSGHDSTRFPADIATLVRGLFPDDKRIGSAESGVVLLYSPKDYMPVHRDVSEQCERGLASFSLGCDGLFVVAKDSLERTEVGEEEVGQGESEKEEDKKIVVLRVGSGDVVVMDGETRWAWHAMPKVLAGTCPALMRDWPAGSEGSMGVEEGAFERWKGYMAGKRLNISCRQVFE